VLNLGDRIVVDVEEMAGSTPRPVRIEFRVAQWMDTVHPASLQGGSNDSDEPTHDPAS
jgi:hypothetical protein